MQGWHIWQSLRYEPFNTVHMLLQARKTYNVSEP
jgi:hypothetical protein